MKRTLLIPVLVIIAIMAFSSIASAADAPNLVGAFFIKGKVGLKWNPVTGAGEYNIYRKTADTEFAKIGTTAKTNYFDTQLLAGVVFTYKITAVVNGNEIEGKTKDVKMPAEIDAFSAPKGLVSRLSDRANSIILRWDRVKGSIAYNVMRSTTPGSGYEVVGNASSDSHTDAEDLVAGTVYYYVVSAMNEEFEESENSNEVSMKFGLTEQEQAELDAAESNIRLDSIKLELLFEITEAQGVPLKRPSNIAFNTKGDLYITDQQNYRVVCADANGKVKFTFGTSMDPEERYDPPNGAFLDPFAIAIGPNDQVYVSDIVTNDIQIFTAEGKFVKRIVLPVEEEKRSLRANGLDIFDDGRILCSDVGNQRVLIIDSDGKILKEFLTSETFLCHFPNGVLIIDDNSFVHTNPVIGRVITSNFDGEELLRFGTSGTNLGSFGRAVGVSISEDGMYWVTDAMGSTIQAFNKEGELKIAIASASIANESHQLAGPRGIIVKNNIIYLANERKDKVMAFKYTITKIER